jgi:hypothetical protein
VRIVLDHVLGSRRGQRQEFGPVERLRFGRHPDNEVSFDAHRDLDASSRHAELRRRGDGYVLADVGSSNGTWVDGERVSELPIAADAPILVEFGNGGPRVRIFVGEGEPPAPPRGGHQAGGAALWLGLAVAVAVGVAAAIAWL